MRKSSYILALAILCLGCSENSKTNTGFSVKNTLKLSRNLETVEISIDSLGLTNSDVELYEYEIIDADSKKIQLSQAVDSDQDGVIDKILFQPYLGNLEEKLFEVSLKKSVQNEAPEVCYSRFVPERTDDYAWENDRVAFRTYGPTAQQMTENKAAGGTLSSGIDAWLKKVDYPIINKWYKKELETNGTYHEDTGEGLDNFHVGVSRGVGGTAFKKDSIYTFSKNFKTWKNLYNGPIRTSFVLTYDGVESEEGTVKEKKIISLDRGSNLSHYLITANGVDEIYSGLTLHENDGEIFTKTDDGFVSYWQPHKASELGTAIVSTKEYVKGHDTVVTEDKDLSNLYMQLYVIDDQTSFYAGFGWKESNQFTTADQWNAYLKDFAFKLDNPLLVSYH